MAVRRLPRKRLAVLPGWSPVLKCELVFPCGIPLMPIKAILWEAGMHDVDTVAITSGFSKNRGCTDAQALFIAALNGCLGQRASQRRANSVDQHKHAASIERQGGLQLTDGTGKDNPIGPINAAAINFTCRRPSDGPCKCPRFDFLSQSFPLFFSQALAVADFTQSNGRH